MSASVLVPAQHADPTPVWPLDDRRGTYRDVHADRDRGGALCLSVRELLLSGQQQRPLEYRSASKNELCADYAGGAAEQQRGAEMG